MNEKEKAIQRLHDIYEETKKSNWDSYDADSISKETIDLGVLFLQELILIGLQWPMTYPLNDGGVSFDFEGDNSTEENRCVFEIEMSPNAKRYNYLLMLGNTSREGTDLSHTEILKIARTYRDYLKKRTQKEMLTKKGGA